MIGRDTSLDRSRGSKATWTSLAVLFAAAWAFAAGVWAQRDCVSLGPDGWMYWESSVSIARGLGYRYFGGQPVTLWPPGFSIYLAAWQAGLGPTARTLAIATSAAAAGGAGAFTWLVVRRLDATASGKALVVATALLFGTLLARPGQWVLADTLIPAVFGLLLASLLRWNDPRREGGAPGAGRGTVALAILGSTLLLIKNSALALVVAAAASLLWWSRDRPRRSSASLAAAAALGFPVAVWLLARGALGQTASHALRDWSSVGDILRVLSGASSALVGLVGPQRLGAGAILLSGLLLFLVSAWAERAPRDAAEAGGRTPTHFEELATAAFFAFCAQVALFAVVAETSPGDWADARFQLPILCCLLAALVLAIAATPTRWKRLLGWALLLALLAVHARRNQFWMVRAAENRCTGGLSWSARLDPSVFTGSTVPPGASVVRPPDYPWIDRASVRGTE